MKLSKLKQRKIVIICTIILLVLVVLSGVTYKYLSQNLSGGGSSKIKTSEEVIYTSEEEIIEAQKRSGIPFKKGSVDSSNLDYYWLNETVVDGSFSCYVFNKQTYQIYGSTYTTAGFGSPSKSGRTYYQNQEYDINFIEQTLGSVCSFSTQ